MTQTGISLIAMLAVDRCHRPNASAFLMLTSHLLGDVPLPIIMGLIKDKLAPSCRIGSSGDFVDRAQCSDEKTGIRTCLAIAYTWVLLALIFFEIARRYAHRHVRREIGKARSEEHNSLLLHDENCNEEGGSFQYYHCRFRPSRTNSAKVGDILTR